MLKIISIVGARPQFIKLGPLSSELRKSFEEKIVHTGQHYDEKMSSLLFKDLEIPKPDYNLSIGSGNHGEQTGKMLSSIEEILLKEKPDAVVVFGDTNSTLAGALAAVKLEIPSFHVEAGLRSFNRSMPEEINRVVADHTSDFLLAPTQTAVDNLKVEGLQAKTYLTGDIMVDALTNNLEKAKILSKIESEISLNEDFYLLTLHRPYNVDSPENLKLIFNKLSETGMNIIFPVHPRTRKIIESNSIEPGKKFKLIEPLGYLDFLKLQSLSKKILTDSGGIQKEAYLLEKPCITLRPETEWVETVQNGWNILADYKNSNFVDNILSFSPFGTPAPVFGEQVAEQMANLIDSKLILD